MAIYAQNLPKKTLLEVRELGKANSKWINDLITKGLNKIKKYIYFSHHLPMTIINLLSVSMRLFFFSSLFFFFQQTEEVATLNSNRTTARLTQPWDHLDQCFKNYPHKNLFQLAVNCLGSNSGPITFQLCDLNLLTSALFILTSESTKWC